MTITKYEEENTEAFIKRLESLNIPDDDIDEALMNHISYDHNVFEFGDVYKNYIFSVNKKMAG